MEKVEFVILILPMLTILLCGCNIKQNLLLICGLDKMNITISKRKLESYKRAEKVCQIMREQIASNKLNLPKMLPFLLRWLKVTGEKIKFVCPKGYNE